MENNEFDFWQGHSKNYLEMALRTDKREILENPDGYGKRTGDCGDTVEMFLTVDRDRIRSVSINTQGCMNTNACANTVAHLAEGKRIEEAWEITPETVAKFLETLPVEEIHCAELAVGAFYLALTDFRKLQQTPWKKAYRRVVSHHHSK
jgi:nitrogen fixation NifU-like protein